MNETDLYSVLDDIHERPGPFSVYTARELWTDPHTSEQMLAYHLNGDIDVSSRRTAFIDRSTKWIAEHFGLTHGARVADLGCGPGLYAQRLAALGARVTGVDFSERSLRHAREQAQDVGLDIEYVHGDYLVVCPQLKNAGRFDLVQMVMCDFCALGPAQRAGLLAAMRGLLAPGGAVLLDVYSLAAFAAREEQSVCVPNLLDGFWSPQPYYGFLNVFRYEAERVVLDKYTIVEPDRVRTVYNWLQYFDAAALEAEFAAAGFTVEAWLGDVAGSSFDPDAAEFAMVARVA